mmetsp:Transcript_4993/g.5782  ORF Transcript_4993/g.5782 Transcript_4993/m.5782 type:complete len:394 (-) Transcript_4993:274-1455(-)
MYRELNPAIYNGDGSESTWINLGYWPSPNIAKVNFPYQVACENLALLVGETAQLTEQTKSLLDLGCGRGDSLLLWRKKYGIESVVGVNVTASECVAARKRSSCEVHCQDAVTFVADSLNAAGTQDVVPREVSAAEAAEKKRKKRSTSGSTWLSNMVWSLVTPILTKEEDGNDFVVVRNAEAEVETDLKSFNSTSDNEDSLNGNEKSDSTESIQSSHEGKKKQEKTEERRGYEAVVIVDALYHFDTRIDFFRNLSTSGVLQKGGRIAAIDVFGTKQLSSSSLTCLNLTSVVFSPLRTLLLKLLSIAGGIPFKNLMYKEEMFRNWCTAPDSGYTDYSSKDITERVLPGFFAFAWSKGHEANSFTEKAALYGSALFMKVLYHSGLVRIYCHGMTRA